MSYIDFEPEDLSAAIAADRAERRSLGYDAVCTRCGQHGPTSWMIEGTCGPNLTEIRPCVTPRDLRDVPLGWPMSLGVAGFTVVWGYLIWRWIVG